MPKNSKTRFFYVLISDNTWVFHQSEHVQSPSYIINSNKTWGFDQSDHVQGPIYYKTKEYFFYIYDYTYTGIYRISILVFVLYHLWISGLTKTYPSLNADVSNFKIHTG